MCFVTGLSDVREHHMCEQLERRAGEVAGEMMMGDLCEVLLDLLTEANHPDGDCCFCLFPLDHARGSPGGQSANDADVLKLPCFHAFHRCASGP
jgi:E3 ubiquitin-protein ligase RNF25